MKTIISKLKSKATLLLMFFVLGTATPIVSLVAQPKITDFSAMESEVSKASTSMINIAKIVIGVVFAIGLIFVIYNVITKNAHAKEWVIGYIIGLVLYIVFVAFL